MNKVWYTRHALSTGVVILEGGEFVDGDDGKPKYYSWKGASGYGHVFASKKEWHLTELEARLRVQEMIDAKRKSLQKQLRNLDACTATGLVMRADIKVGRSDVDANTDE